MKEAAPDGVALAVVNQLDPNTELTDLDSVQNLVQSSRPSLLSVSII